MWPWRLGALSGLLFAALTLPAASQTAPPPTTGPGARPAPQARPPVQKATAAVRPPVERPAEPASQGGIDWKSAVTGARRSEGDQALLGKLDRAAIDKTAVPILLPADPALTGNARLYSFGDYYSLSADLPGVGVSMSGTTTTVALPAQSPLKMSADTPEQLVIQRTVDGQLASFVRFGVLYTVEVRCDDPKDSRCRNETLVRQIQGQTNRVVMGRAARQAAGLGG
ncbi:MAG: hypothetical protein QE280_02220 [Caulobacter sp.]|nr:hypothetical protein [Caulobacter sp.]